MLSEQERREIEDHLGHYAQRRAAGPEALVIAQRRPGWISDETLCEVAALVGMTSDELDEVATFYNLIFRKPVGKHVILLCDSVSCWIMGYDTVYRHLADRLGVEFGKTTSDGLFTLLPTVCLGACDHAPTMMIDGRLYGDLTPRKIDEILADYGK